MKKPSLAIDLGSSNTNIYQLGAGVVLSEPSVVAAENGGNGRIKAVGDDAKKLIGKTADGTVVISPIFEARVENSRAASAMLDRFLNKVTIKKLGMRPDVLFSVPCGAENSAIKKYEQVCNDCGVYNVHFVESPVLTALGAGVPLSEANPCFLIDAGGGTTTIAAVSLSGTISGFSVNMGGKSIDKMIISHIENEFGLKIGALTAERLKIQVGSLISRDETAAIVDGRDIQSGKPRAVSVTARDIFPVMSMFFDKVFQLAGMLMAKLPAEMCADIRKSGVYFAGGSSRVPGLDEYFNANMGMRANVAEEPELAAAIGGGIVAGDQKLLARLRLNRK